MTFQQLQGGIVHKLAQGLLDQLAMLGHMCCGLHAQTFNTQC